jgi:hypothetical protein
MTKRRVLWLVGSVAVLVGLAGWIPASPLYLPDLLGPHYQGRPARLWIKALDSADPEVRSQAIFALGEIGPKAGAAVPALAAILDADPDHHTRTRAALALSRMVPASRTAVPALAKALKDDHSDVRLNAAVALHRLGDEARPAIPALIEALADLPDLPSAETPPPTTRSTEEVVALALGRASAGTTDAVPALMAALREGDRPPRVRAAIVEALGEIGASAGAAVPLLQKLLRDEDRSVQLSATTALTLIGEGLARGSDVPPDEEDAISRGPSPELPEAEREYLWEIEHHGNLLSKHGFGPLAKALQKTDAEALAGLLADDFRGSDLNKPKRIHAATAYAEVERLQDSGQPPVPLDRDVFIARLLGFRKIFTAKAPQVKLALMTLTPLRRGQLDGDWEGMAQLRLHGESSPGAPAEVVVVLRYQMSRPTEERLSKPGWLQSAGIRQVLIAKAPRYLFAEVARQRGLDSSKLHDNWTSPRFVPAGGGIFVCDFNRDGILDVLITDVNGCALYQGRGDGSFEDVTTRVGLPPGLNTSPAIAWIDIDGDGWEDLILSGRVYRNEGGKRFVDYTSRCNLRLPPSILNLVVGDYDRDGKLDIYATRGARPGKRSWLDGEGAKRGGNFLFRNKGDWQFENVTRKAGAGGGRRSTFTAAWLDANNDGWPDLFVPNEFGDGVLLLNNGKGGFTPQKLADHPADFGTMGVAVGDVNNDGNIDIYCANMYSKAGTRVIGNLAPDAYPKEWMEKLRRFVAGSQLHLNKGNTKFAQVGALTQTAAVGWAYGAALADLDNDGWLDIYATAGYVSRDRNEPDG